MHLSSKFNLIGCFLFIRGKGQWERTIRVLLKIEEEMDIKPQKVAVSSSFLVNNLYAASSICVNILLLYLVSILQFFFFFAGKLFFRALFLKFFMNGYGIINAAKVPLNSSQRQVCNLGPLVVKKPRDVCAFFLSLE